MKKILNFFWLVTKDVDFHKLLTMKIALCLVFCGIVNIMAGPSYSLATKVSYNSENSYYINNDAFGLITELQQQNTISGTVTDESTGEAMPGVNVVVGTTIGQVTDINGKYTITVPDQNAVLVFSFIGYNTIEQPVSGRTTINIALISATQALDEVIVIGYGVQKKSDLTGSVTRVDMEQKTAQANVNIIQALSGSSAGVNVVGTGVAGEAPDLSIRGQTSLSASDAPLIVVDGIIYNGAITNINVNDVETIDILKDASAAAVYGSRSANGVMIITTKKGKTEKPVISFNMYYGYQDMTNSPMKVMNGEQYAVRLVDYSWEQKLYAWYKTKPTSDAGKPIRPDVTDRNIVASYLRSGEEKNNYLAGNEIDWVKEVLQIAPIQDYNLSVAGKTDRSNYFISGSYSDEKGIEINDEFSRITMRANIESKITDWLTVGLNTSYSYRDYSGTAVSLGDARVDSPWANNHIGSPIYDIDLSGESYHHYPFDNLFINNKNIMNSLFIIGNGKITVPWVKGLTYDFNYSNTYSNTINNTFNPITTSGGRSNKGSATKNFSEERNWIINNIITYLRTFGDHQLNVTLLYSRENRNSNSSTLNATGFDNEALGYNNMGLGTIATVASSAWEENSLSYMARLNYTYKSRYMLTGTVRRDGFSGFGPNNKFATFPSVSFGWVASDESFLRDVTWLYLKLRTSYGLNGNQGIGRYSSFSRMSTSGYVYGASTLVTVSPSTLGNANLGWESTASLNVGIDYGLFDRRISGSINVYKAKTSDVLVTRTLPPSTGYSSVWTNIGTIDNKGIELELTTNNLTGPLGWKTNFTFSLNRDKISKLYGGENDQDIGNSWFVGEPISAIYDYEMAGGLWTEAELYSGNILANWYPGQYKYVDQDGDVVIAATYDRKIIGYRTPNYRFSINNTLTYKNFTFSFFINSIMGGGGYYMANNASAVNVDSNSDTVYRNNASAVRQYWTPDNGVDNSTGIYHTPAVLSGIYESRSFVRLQDVSLSYTFGPKVLQKLKLVTSQFFIASKNPYVWTEWSNWDPETGTSNTPIMRNITAGFRITL